MCTSREIFPRLECIASMENLAHPIIESVDSISSDEPDSP